MQSSVSPCYHEFMLDLSQTTMFEEYIRGRICSLGITVVRKSKDGDLHLTKRSKKLRKSLSSTSSITSDNSVSSQHCMENFITDEKRKSKLSNREESEPANFGRTNIDNSKNTKIVTNSTSILQTAHSQRMNSTNAHIFSHYVESDNTSSFLTEKDNVPRDKNVEEECQLQKTYGNDKEGLSSRRKKVKSI